MRTLIALLVGLSLGCTPKGYCDSVAPGQPVPASAKSAGRESWCGTHPARDYVGPQGFDGGADLVSYGEFNPEDTEQCCLLVQDGGVIAKWVGYD